jgi:hypothetical protein
MEEAKIVWTDYMKYRLKLRSYDLSTIEHILRYSSERYVDTASGRLVVIGVHGKLLVMIPYECKGGHVDRRDDTCDEPSTNQFSTQIREA